MALIDLMARRKGWLAVDLDGTLAEYHGFNKKNPYAVGRPIPKMVACVKRELANGVTVKIFTARVDGGSLDPTYKDVAKVRAAIQIWCKQHLGQVLEITNVKDALCFEIWDDRCRQVIKNTGEFAVQHMVHTAFVRAKGARR